MRVAAIRWCGELPGLQVYFFRRIREDLIKNHLEGPKGFYALLAPWVAAGWCEIIEDEIRFWNGSKIYICHCQHEKDVFKYQGSEIHCLCMDELTHFTETQYRFLRNRVRMVGIDAGVFAGRFPRILCSANPGGIGHLWVKNTFITNAEPMSMHLQSATEGGMRRQYIPARLEDNPSMQDDDPGYEQRLEGLGSKTLVRAMRWGDWDVIEGAFFDCWSTDKHVVPPFTIPEDWPRFRSGDWGSASPFSFGWWAVVQDDYYVGGDSKRNVGYAPGAPRAMGDVGQRRLPRGAILRYREDYGDQDGSAGKGLKLTAEEVADRIIERERKDPKLVYGVLDPSTFKADGGPPIAERINQRLVKHGMVPFRQADNRRVNTRMSRDRGGPMSGWDAVRARMVGDGNTPTIFCFSTCLDSIRTIPALQHDMHRAEDLDTMGEDHAADEWRYACMSRAFLKTKHVEPEWKNDYDVPYTDYSKDSFKTL